MFVEEFFSYFFVSEWNFDLQHYGTKNVPIKNQKKSFPINCIIFSNKNLKIIFIKFFFHTEIHKGQKNTFNIKYSVSYQYYEYIDYSSQYSNDLGQISLHVFPKTFHTPPKHFSTFLFLHTLFPN